jgi:hypothetical protein
LRFVGFTLTSAESCNGSIFQSHKGIAAAMRSGPLAAIVLGRLTAEIPNLPVMHFEYKTLV